MTQSDLYSLSAAESRALVRLLMAAMFVDGDAHTSEKFLLDELLRKANITPDVFDAAKSMSLEQAIEVYRRATPSVALAIKEAIRQMVMADGVVVTEELSLERLLGIKD